MEEKYNPKARLSAFIFVENKLYLAKTHTDCLITLLIEKKLLKNEKQFFKMLNSNKDKYKKQIENWSKEVEKCSIFGELSFFNHQLSLFVFDDINNYGLECLKFATINQYGNIPLYYAKYDTTVENNFKLIKL